MKKFKKPASLILALCLVFALAVSACADNNITASGGSGTTPVSLSSTTDGSSGGDPAGTAMNVTVPTSLPMTMSQDGDVLTADNCRITNNSYGAVRVASVSISAAEGWNLTAFGDKASLAGEKVDSNKLGFALSIGGGAQVATASDEATQSLITAPIEGCYMTGAGDSSRNTEGSGLGLSIARSLVQLQKGELELTVDGDLFKVTLRFRTVD